MNKLEIHSKKVGKFLLITNGLVALIYFSWWFFPTHLGNPVLYFLLLFGETYHLFMLLSFLHTLWPKETKILRKKNKEEFSPTIDVFIPVTDEPPEVIRKTVLAAKGMEGYAHNTYILNDGFAAGKPNWERVENLALELGVTCITRKRSWGAKAGNINNGLMFSSGEIIVIFDADMVPYPNFLKKVIPYFGSDKVAFVQTPQYYRNHSENYITGTSWEQQEFFFGAIMIGKNGSNSAFICGTNVAIRRRALLEVGGMYEKSIAEDFLTSILIHEKGWTSHYVPNVLAEGLAPYDFLSYFKQQSRWARGSIEVLLRQNPFFKKTLTFRQKIEYLASSLYYFNGFIVLIDITMPLIFLFTGIQPVTTTTTSFALFFLPYMFLILSNLYISSKGYLTFRAISFSYSSWLLQLIAIKSSLFNEKSEFMVTPKKVSSGNFMHLVYVHISYSLLVFLGIGLSIYREGINPSVITNAAWGLFNVIMFFPYIKSSYDWESLTRGLRFSPRTDL